MKELIINNPYRILGVYVGDSPATEQKNLARFHAFEKVGQTYEVSLVGEDNLPEINRTIKSVEESVQKLSLPEDRVKYSLLWFSDGKTEWGKVLNQAVTALINEDYANALTAYNELITTESLRDYYIKAVTHGLATMSQYELADVLEGFFFRDKGFQKFLSSSARSIPKCFLSQSILNNYQEFQRSEIVQLLNDQKFDVLKAVKDFSKTQQELNALYAKVEDKAQGIRQIFGEVSESYQHFALSIAEVAFYSTAQRIQEVVDVLYASIPSNTQNGQNSPLEPTIKLSLNETALYNRLMEEYDKSLQKLISSLKLESNSESALQTQKSTYQKILKEGEQVYQYALSKSNKRFFTTAFSILLVVLIVVYFWIVSNK